MKSRPESSAGNKKKKKKKENDFSKINSKSRMAARVKNKTTKTTIYLFVLLIFLI